MKYTLYDRRERMSVIWEIDFYCLIRLRYIHIASLQTVGSEKPNSEKSRKLNFIIMCFGNNMSQKDDDKFDPVPNNYCGGFALDAVLTDGKPKNANPKGTYDKIMDKQKKGNLTSRTYSSQFVINSAKQTSTAMSLPSSIAFVASDEKFNPCVFYASCLEKVFGNVLKEEVNCLYEMVTEVKEDNFWNAVEKDASDYPYFIVLVHNSHWVAVKKIAKNNFVCYNPGNGECTKESAESMTQALYKAGYGPGIINPLVIALKKMKQ